MLNILRQKKESFLIKIVLGTIILSFAAFFGASSLAPGSGTADSPASVNGHKINPSKYNYMVNSQLERLRTQFKNKLPDYFVDSTRRNVLLSLIDQELINQELNKMGIKATPQELAQFVKDSPQFKSEDGSFNLNYYKNRFLPGYQLATGSSYEHDMLQQLAAQKFFDELEELLTPNEQELNLDHQIKNTKFKFSVIKIAKTQKKPDDKSENSDTSKDNLTPKEQADKIFDLWKANKDITKLLKQHKLSKRPTPELTYSRLKTVFDGKDDLKLIKELVALSNDKPFPANYIDQGNFYYLVKLEDRQMPEKTLSDQDKTDLQNSYQISLTNSLQASFIKDLKNRSEIEIYLKQQQ